MKKLLVILLTLSILSTFVACDENDPAEAGANSSNVTAPTVPSSTTEPTETETAEDGQEKNGLDDFKEKMEENGIKTTESKTEDGILVQIVTPTIKPEDKDTSVTPTPVLPSIDTAKPTVPTIPTPVVPEQDKTGTEDSSASQTPTPSSPSQEETPKQEEVGAVEYTYTTGQTHTRLPYTERYLYSTLTEEQKGWYRKIDAAINNLEEKVVLNADLSSNKNYYILYLYLYDNPEHFYVANQMMVSTAEGGSLLLFYAVGNQPGEYCGYGKGPMTEELKNKIRAKKQVFETEVNRILSTIPANAPDVWKERLIYDRILTDCSYNLSATWDGLANDNWTAYGIIVNKTGICEAYSEAFQVLCLYAGLNCTEVVGTAGGGHKWNAIKIEDEWYMCDITFDDPVGGEAGAAYHYYFNCTSEQMAAMNHDWSGCEFSVPNCNGEKYAFSTYFSH